MSLTETKSRHFIKSVISPEISEKKPDSFSASQIVKISKKDLTHLKTSKNQIAIVTFAVKTLGAVCQRFFSFSSQ